MVREESLTETEEAILGSTGARREGQPGQCSAPGVVAVGSRRCRPPERMYPWLILGVCLAVSPALSLLDILVGFSHN